MEHGFLKHFLQKNFVTNAKEGIQNLKYHWSVFWSRSIPIDRHVPVFIKAFFRSLLEKFCKTDLGICGCNPYTAECAHHHVHARDDMPQAVTIVHVGCVFFVWVRHAQRERSHGSRSARELILHAILLLEAFLSYIASISSSPSSSVVFFSFFFFVCNRHWR
jgi:hypothetical protein